MSQNNKLVFRSLFWLEVHFLISFIIRDPLNLGSLVWNYSGVFNWAFLLLALVALKMFLENINKYGVRIDPRLWVKFAFGDLHFDRLEFPAVFVLVFANISLLVALKTEQGLAKVNNFFYA